MPRFLLATLQTGARRVTRAHCQALLSAGLVSLLFAGVPERKSSFRSNSAVLQQNAKGYKWDFGNVSGLDSREIPFEFDSNHVFLQGTVNSSGPLWFTLDTGASGTLIATKRAQALGLNLRGGIRTEGAGGTVESFLVSDVSLGLPGASLPDLDITAVSLDGLESNFGRPVDLILGSELFRRYVVEIDYAAKVLRLYEPGSYQYHGTGEVLPITLHENHPFVRASIETAGAKAIPNEFVIDVGSGFCVLLQRNFIEAHRELQSLREVLKTDVAGIGGSVPVAISRLGRLRLGRVSILAPVTIFPRTSKGSFALKPMAGNIGNEILRRFKVTFDYSRLRMILEPNNDFDEPNDYDMSGISLVAERPTFRVFRIERILENSPATDAGLRVGDSIVELDRRPVADLGLGKLRKMFKQPGRVYDLTVQRGGNAFNVKLKLRRLI